MYHRKLIEDAFADLETKGVLARADFECCNGCAGARLFNDEVPTWKGPVPLVGVAFFHEQATDSANDGGSLYIGFDAVGSDTEEDRAEVGLLVSQVLRDHGFQTKWDGTGGQKIAVLPPRTGWTLDYERPQDEPDEDEEYDDGLRDEDDGDMWGYHDGFEER